MRKGVFRLNTNNEDPDQSAEIYSLIRNFAILSYILYYTCTMILYGESEGP